MKKYLNFSLYTPEMSGDEETPAGALFLRSEDGVDWYEAQTQFKANTLKVMFDASGVICCAEVDAAGMWPIDCSVIEVNADKIPSDFLCNGQWVWNGNEISQKELSQDEVLARNEAKKSRLMTAANSAISPLQMAVKHNIATNEEKSALERWEIYTVLLSRVDISDPLWPDAPQ